MSRSITRRVRRAYRQKNLTRILTMPEQDFGKAFGMETVSVDSRSSWKSKYWDEPAEDYYHYRDNGSNVLAVAHLDTVVRPKGRKPTFHDTSRGPAVMSGALDDRLGAYVILDLLPKVGVNTDILLTVGEESAASTAEYFKPNKDYEHIIEFDRMGTDVVMYQYEDRASRKLVEAAGAEMGHGSFSDIAYLEHLGVKAFNWGVGYQGNYHSEKGYAFLNDTFAMVGKYVRFHRQNAGVTLWHEEGLKYRYSSKWDIDDDLTYCEFCSEKKVDVYTGYCGHCGYCADCGELKDEGCECYTPPLLRKGRDDEEPEVDTGVAALPGLNWNDYLARPSDESSLNWGEWVDKHKVYKKSSTPTISWSEYLASRPDKSAPITMDEYSAWRYPETKAIEARKEDDGECDIS